MCFFELCIFIAVISVTQVNLFEPFLSSEPEGLLALLKDEIIHTNASRFSRKFISICFYAFLLQVGFCNLIKRAKDQMNHLWVADATENSTYFLSFDSVHCSHLKEAALSTQGWAKMSDLVMILPRVWVIAV